MIVTYNFLTFGCKLLSFKTFHFYQTNLAMQKTHTSLLVILAFFSATTIFAQKQEIYFHTRILLDGKTMADLAALGIETDHGRYEPGQYFQSDYSESELARVKAAGFRMDTLIADVAAWYLRENAGRKPARTEAASSRGAGPCDGFPYPVATPVNYTYGSMGGYYTYEEFLAVLDDMRDKFPHLISAREKVSETLVTHENRPLWYVRISDNPDSDETEPEALYTALHHAREPNSLSHLIFFMWHLLENYATDADLRYLVNNTELYFIPCLNPDGYIYNQTTNPQGGGFWRKNRRNNGDGSYGVDLNRNYGYNWGPGFNGSSSNTFSETYHGPAAFSEPETQMVKGFAQLHDFQIALNCHTSGNLLVHPWGYEDIVPTPDFDDLGAWLTRENGYLHGSCFQTLNYFANGYSDDWWYAEKDILAFTPETGYAFWPFIDDIDELNKGMLTLNLSAAWYTLGGAVITHEAGETIAGNTLTVPFLIKRYELGDGPIQVTFEPLTANIVSIAPVNALNLTHFETANIEAAVTLGNAIQPGELIRFVAKTNLGGQIHTDTFQTLSGYAYQTLFSETGSVPAPAWATTGWDQTSEDFHSPAYSMTDSPFEFYDAGDNMLTLAQPVEIPAQATEARLRFFAKWDIEPLSDWAQVLISTDNAVTFLPLQGRYTVTGLLTPDPDEPVYGNTQSDWVQECIDLANYTGQPFFLRFLMHGENGMFRDGFYFDDLFVEYKLDDGVFTKNIASADFWISQNQPNPANGRTVVTWSSNTEFSANPILEVRAADGRVVTIRPVNNPGNRSVEIETTSWPAGLYLYRLADGAKTSVWKKMAVLR